MRRGGWWVRVTLRWRRRGSFNGLVAFNKFLGMATKGFEEEILTLLNKIRTRKGQEGQALAREVNLLSLILKESLRSWSVQ